MEKLTKAFAVKQASVDGRTITGSASVMGVMDRYGDVMCPRCFQGAIAGFMANGFVPVGHDWGDMGKVAAMPTVCEERGANLYTEAVFHSTEYANDVLTVCQERLAQGLSVGLSIGFNVSGSEWFSCGSELMAWAKGRGYDMSLFDPAIEDCEDGVRAIHEVKELFEYSIVAVPANPKATATSIKDFYSEGVSLAERLDSVCAAAEKALAELGRVSELRSADGRSLSAERLAQAKRLAGSLLAISEAGEVAPPDNPAGIDEAALIAQAFLLTA